ncbi:PqqD family protein [Thermogemmatispora sp.]|uniref:PqqD family protein n=1 Tax=Thermogemmatispora sp. TaxID=1968838 RepID=UPI0035E43BB5
MIPVLPTGVVVHGDSLEDQALLQHYPLNSTAREFLILIDGRRSLASIAEQLAERYRQPREVLLRDLSGLCQELYRHSLLNWHETWLQRGTRWLLALRTRRLPTPYTWRSDPPRSKNTLLLLGWLCLEVWRAWLPVLSAGLLVATVTGALLAIFPQLTLAYLALALSLTLSISLHEGGHLLVLRHYCGAGSGFFLRTGPLLRLVRPPLERPAAEIAVNVAGPLLPGCVALLALVWHLFHAWPLDWMVITLFGVHLLQLVLPNPDLNDILRAWHSGRRRREMLDPMAQALLPSVEHERRPLLMSRNSLTETATQQRFTGTFIRSTVAGIFIGAVMALLITLLGFLGILLYGLINAPQDIHLKILSLKIFDFTSQGTSFSFQMHIQGAVIVLGLLTLLAACVFWMLRGVHRLRPRPS